MTPYAALYERLSREEDNDGESASIAHQKEVLETYAVNHGYPQFRHFTDDGYTGRNFQRPGFQEMLREVEQGHVSAVIVRDLSRLGRNYMETGHYMEEVFPKHHVRFIALMNDVDMTSKSDAVMAPLFNLINDWYSRDLSRRYTVANHIRQQSGIRCTPYPVYGYRTLPGDTQHWVIDPVASVTIRRIYRMGLEGYALPAIVRQLQEDGVLRPAVYARSIGYQSADPAHPDTPDTLWESSVISRILHSPEYKGTKTLRKTEKRNGKNHVVPHDRRLLFPEDHEAIIPPFLWDAVHNRRAGHSCGYSGHSFLSLPFVPHVFSCSCCGRKLRVTRKRGTIYLQVRPREGRGAHQICELAAMEPVIRAVIHTLWDSIPDPEGLLEALGREKHRIQSQKTDSKQTRREDLEARKRAILHHQIRLDRDREQGLLDEALIRVLHGTYAEELEKIRQEEDSLLPNPDLEIRSVSKEEVLDAMLRTLFVFLLDVSISPLRKETCSHRIRVKLRVKIPHPDYLRLQYHKKLLNISWEIPEDAPTVEEALLSLAATDLIL